MQRRTHRRGRTLATVGAAASLIAGLGVTQIAGAAPSATSALSNSRPAFVARAIDRGPVNSAAPVDFEVLLQLPDESARGGRGPGVVHPGKPVVPEVPHAGAVPLHLLAVGRRRWRPSSRGSARCRSDGEGGGSQSPLCRGDRDHGPRRVSGRNDPPHLRLQGPGSGRACQQLHHPGHPERRGGRGGEPRRFFVFAEAG
jgi:hypothetical protein